MIPAFLAPTIAFVGAFLLLIAIYWVFKRMTASTANRVVPHRPALLGHVLRLHARRERRAEDDGRDRARALHERLDRHLLHPDWVKVTAGLAIAAGTYVGGWRIMRTLGQRIFKMDPPSGFAAQTSAGAMIVVATRLGFPLSTTQ